MIKAGAAVLTTALLLTSAPAMADRGYGASLQSVYLPGHGDPELITTDPGWLSCLGGVGYHTNKRGMRIGGDGAYCTSDSPVRMLSAGMQLGYQVPVFGFYGAFYNTTGVGYLVDLTAGDRYRALSVYVRPTVAVGTEIFGVMGELGLFVHVPLNMVQWVQDSGPRGYVTPSVGLSASVMFGRATTRHRKKERAVVMPEHVEVPPEDLAIPANPPPPPPPQEAPQVIVVPAPTVVVVPAPEG